MMVISIVFGIATGRTNEVTESVLNSSLLSVDLCIGFVGVWALWLGLMEIAKASGLITKLAKIMNPIIKRIFPKIPPTHPALGAITMNMAANMLGLGNAATPFGIKAMKELQKLNTLKDIASNSMCTFLVINTSSIQIVPTTVIALRVAQGSTNATEIVFSALLATTFSTLAGLIAIKFMKDRKIK